MGGSPSSTKKDVGVHMTNPSVERGEGSAINILYADKSKLISIALLSPRNFCFRLMIK